MKKILGFIIFLIVLTVVLEGNFKTKGTFKEFVIDDYIEESESKEIASVMVEDLREPDWERTESTDINIIDKILNEIGELEVYEYRNDFPKMTTDQFRISFKNARSYERLDIILMEDNYIYIRMNNTKVTRENKDIIRETIRTRKYIQVINKEIDNEFIDYIISLVK